MSDRREQRQRERREKRVAKHAAKENYKRHNAPSRIRGAATACIFFGFLAILGGTHERLGNAGVWWGRVYRDGGASGHHLWRGRLARGGGALHGGSASEGAGRRAR